MIEPQRPMPRSSMVLSLGWAVAVCLIVALAILVTNLDRLRSELGRTRDRAASLSRDLDSERRWALALASPGVRTASFTLTPSGDLSLRARATVDPESRKALVVFEGIKPPGGHGYELWALRGNTPVSLGRIRTDATGRAVLRIEDVGDVDAVTALAISLEPEGGAQAPGAPVPDAAAPNAPPAREPNGPIVMIGSLGG